MCIHSCYEDEETKKCDLNKRCDDDKRILYCYKEYDDSCGPSLKFTGWLLSIIVGIFITIFAQIGRRLLTS